MKLTFIIAAFSATVASQLTLDAFNSILGEAVEDAGIPQCGLSCLNDAFSFSKTSRGCFVNSGNLDCLCDDDDIEGSLMLCGDRACAATETAGFQYSIQKLCENRPVVSSTSSTSSSTSMASSTNASSISSTTFASFASPTPSPSSSATSAQDPDSATPYNEFTPLSTGAKAGIGAGAGALTLLATLLAFFLIRRHKRKQNPIPLEILAKPPSYDEDQKAELMGSPATPYLTPAMTPGDGGSRFTVSPRSEMGLGVFEGGHKQEHHDRDLYLAGRYVGENYQYQRDGEVAELGGDGPVELAGGDEYRRDSQPTKVVTESPSLIALNLKMPNSRSSNC